jgi:hypothetical protein
MRFFISKAPADRMHSEQLGIKSIGEGRARLSFHLTEAVDDRPFSQRIVARAQGTDIQEAHRTFQYLASRDDDLRTLGADPWRVTTLIRVQEGHPLVEAFEFTEGHFHTCRLRSLFGRRHGAKPTKAQCSTNGQDGARGSRCLLPQSPAQLTRRTFQSRANLFA